MTFQDILEQKPGTEYINFLSEDNNINYSIMPEEIKEIFELMINDCNSLDKCYIHFSRLFIKCVDAEADRKLGEILNDPIYKNNKAKQFELIDSIQTENELMLRINTNKLVIAKLTFINQRKGNMTKLYTLLKDIRIKYNLGPIEFEACNEKSSAWCIKNGMIEKPGTKETYIEPN